MSNMGKVPTFTGKVHPAAEVFRLLEGEEMDKLVESVRQHGLLEPCWLDAEGRLLDGRNRLRACADAGVEPRFRVYEGDDPVGFIVAVNIDRRHIDVGQRAMLALTLLSHFEAQAQRGRPKKSVNVANRPHLSEQKRAPLARDLAAKAVGTSGRVVARAKRIAEQAPDIADQVKAGRVALDAAEKQLRRRLAEQQEAEARAITVTMIQADAGGDDWRLLHGDFRERLAELEPGSVDLIVTDPPYPREFIDLWGDLSEVAARILKPQGVLAAMTGKIMLPDVIERLGRHLAYGWVYCQPLPGSNSRIMARHTLQSWKPWVAYSNGPWPSGRIDWHEDVLTASERAKSRYRWEQDPTPAGLLIEMLSSPGALVVDPFTGTGAYGAAAIVRGRRFVGCEVDEPRFTGAAKRLGCVA